MKYFRDVFVVCLLVSAMTLYGCFVAGSERTVTMRQAAAENQAVNQSRTEFLSSNVGFLSIFENNYGITLVTLTPAGIFYMPLVQYDTGYVIALLAKATDTSVRAYDDFIVFSPIGILEFLSYIFAFGECLFLFYSLFTHEFKDWLKTHLSRTFMFVTAILLFSAWLEWKFFL